MIFKSLIDSKNFNLHKKFYVHETINYVFKTEAKMSYNFRSVKKKFRFQIKNVTRNSLDLSKKQSESDVSAIIRFDELTI